MARKNKIIFVDPYCAYNGINTPGIGFLRGFLADKGINSSVVNFDRLFFEKENEENREFLDRFKKYLCQNILQGARLLSKTQLSKILLELGVFLSPQKMATILLFFINFCPEKIWAGVDFLDPLEKIYRKYLPAPDQFSFLGISLVSSSQLIFSLSLAKYIKKISKGRIKVVFGGNFITSNYEKIISVLERKTVVDFLVVGEGETAIWKLLTGQRVDSIDNLIYLQGDGYQLAKRLDYYENINDLPAPLFEPDDIKYIQATRKCCWGKCAFCRLDRNKFVPMVRIRKLEKVMADIEEICKNSNYDSPAQFYFTDSSVPISFLKEFCAEMESKDFLPKTFQAFLRLEKGIDRQLLISAKKAGFRCFYFGLETISPRLLGLINKGISSKKARDIIRMCSELDIRMTVHFMIGLPTQTEKELLEDLEFARSLAEKHTNVHLEIKPFRLELGSEIFNNPDKFGIEIVQSRGANKSFVRPFYRFRQLNKKAVSTRKATAIFKKFSKKIKEPRISRLFKKMYNDYCLPTLFFLKREIK